MAANTSPIFELTALVKGLQFTSADTTAKKSLIVDADIPTTGIRIDQIAVSSNDTAAINLQFYLNDGATDFFIGNVPIAISAGYLAVARVDAIPTLAPALGYLFIPDGFILKCACVATMTAAKTMDVVAFAGKYE